MERNKILKKGKILIVICLVVTLLFMDVKNSIHADIKNSNDVAINDNNNQENGEILDEELTDEEEYIPYLEELPKFKDEFERALFVYGWFYDIGDLFPYLDQNNEIDEEWYLLKATELTSIEDMKELIAEVEGADPRYEALREGARSAGKGYFEFAVSEYGVRGLTELFAVLGRQREKDEEVEGNVAEDDADGDDDNVVKNVNIEDVKGSGVESDIEERKTTTLSPEILGK